MRDSPAWNEHRPFQSGPSCVSHTFAHRASVSPGDRRRGRSVENARPLSPLSATARRWCRGARVGAQPQCRPGAGRCAILLPGTNIARSNPGRVAFPTPSPAAPRFLRGTGAVDQAWKTHDRFRFSPADASMAPGHVGSSNRCGSATRGAVGGTARGGRRTGRGPRRRNRRRWIAAAASSAIASANARARCPLPPENGWFRRVPGGSSGRSGRMEAPERV